MEIVRRVIVRRAIVLGGNCAGGGPIILGGNCPGGNCPRCQLSGGGGNFSGGNCLGDRPGGNCSGGIVMFPKKELILYLVL